MIKKRTSVEFAVEIEELVQRTETTYMDAIIHYCSTNSLEVETAAKLIRQNPTLKGKLLKESVDLKMVLKEEEE